MAPEIPLELVHYISIIEHKLYSYQCLQIWRGSSMDLVETISRHSAPWDILPLGAKCPTRMEGQNVPVIPVWTFCPPPDKVILSLGYG